MGPENAGQKNVTALADHPADAAKTRQPVSFAFCSSDDRIDFTAAWESYQKKEKKKKEKIARKKERKKETKQEKHNMLGADLAWWWW